MIWINLEQIKYHLTHYFPLSKKSISAFSIPQQKNPSQNRNPGHPPKNYHTKPQNRLNRNETTKRPPEPVLLKEPNLPRPLLKASCFSERKGAGRARFFDCNARDIFFGVFFWRVWGGFLCCPGIKIKDHNKQVDLTFHFTQPKKVMLSKPHLKGT